MRSARPGRACPRATIHRVRRPGLPLWRSADPRLARWSSTSPATPSSWRPPDVRPARVRRGALGLLARAAGPDASYFADSRIELIPASVRRDYVAVLEEQTGWEAILDRWQVDVLVLSSGDQPSLVAAVGGSAGWQIVHRDAAGR